MGAISLPSLNRLSRGLYSLVKMAAFIMNKDFSRQRQGFCMSR